MTERQILTSFPSAVAEVMGLDFDTVMHQDPIDWSKNDAGTPWEGYDRPLKQMYPKSMADLNQFAVTVPG